MTDLVVLTEYLVKRLVTDPDMISVKEIANDENGITIQVLVNETDMPKIIGKGGSMIKNISTKARVEMEKFLGKKVYLSTYVKVMKNWRDREKYLVELGIKDIDE